MELKLRCPRCGGGGVVCWNRLDSLLRCGGCHAWYRTSSVGHLEQVPPPSRRLRVQVRSDGTGWRQELAPVGPDQCELEAWANPDGMKKPAWRRRGGWAAAACAALVLIVAGAWLMGRPARRPAVELPTALVERARVFTEAWLAGDEARLLRLVEPTQDRRLLATLLGRAPTSELAAPRVDVEIAREDSLTASVLVRIGQERVVRQRWLNSGGDWYFVPGEPEEKRPAAADLAEPAEPTDPPPFIPSGIGNPVPRHPAEPRETRPTPGDSPWPR